MFAPQPGEYAYLTTPNGGLIPIACSGQISVSTNKQRTEGLSLDGHRRVLVYGRHQARTWEVSGDMPLEVARNLLQIVSDKEHSHREYGLLTPQAQLYNALPGTWIGQPPTVLETAGEAEAVLMSALGGEDSDRLVTVQAHTLPGMPMTASAYASTTIGGGRLVLEFFSATKYLTGTAVTIPRNTPTKRYSVSMVAPEGALYARLAVIGSSTLMAGSPALTWGNTLREHLPPLATKQVYIDPVSYNLSAEYLASAINNCKPENLIQGISFKILEVS